jgi:hypothetical protein
MAFKEFRGPSFHSNAYADIMVKMEESLSRVGIFGHICRKKDSIKRNVLVCDRLKH